MIPNSVGAKNKEDVLKNYKNLLNYSKTKKL
jgi:hypothetical protein